MVYDRVGLPDSKKIVILISNIHHKHLTGQQKIGTTLARHLSYRGLKPLIISNTPNCKSPELYVLNHDLELFVIPGEATTSSYLRSLGDIVRVVGRFVPGIIHGHGMRMSLLTALLGKILGRPTVQTIYDIDVFSHTPSFIKVFGLFLIDQVVCSSEFVRRYLVDAKIAAEKIVVLPYGIEDVWFSLDKPNSQLVNTEGTTVLFWGDAREDRGIDTLLKAIPSIVEGFPHVNFTFAIRHYFPPYSERVRQIARNYPIKIIDYMPDQHISEVVSSAEVIVLPYNATTIQPPLTLLESLAAGKAVVTTDVEANRELIGENERGILVEPKNPNQFVDAIIDLLSDVRRRREIAAEARSFVFSKYNWDNVITKILSLYDDLIDRVGMSKLYNYRRK